MARTKVRIALAVAMVFAVAGVASAQTPKQDVPLVLDFSNNLCVIGPGWCGDARGSYESDSGQTAVVEITYHDYDDNGVGGGFRFYLTNSSRRTVTVKLGPPLPALPAGSWCPEACPRPVSPPPSFTGGAIAEVTSQTMFGWSPPNYDFFTPEDCGIYETEDGRCVSDFYFRFTASRKDYRLRFSPNIWRALTKLDDPTRNTMAYGAVAVQQVSAGVWKITPLLEHQLLKDSNGVPYLEPCPAVLERNDVSKGRSNWVFQGCYAMSFELTLTDPAR
jgi:hypothetical protein